MATYELTFPVNAQSPEPINRIAQAVRAVGESTKAINPAMTDLDAKINKLVASGMTLAGALKQVAAEEAKVVPATAAVATATNTANTSFRTLGTTLQTHTVPQMAAASAALRTLEGHLSIRAAERFITTFKGMGPILQAAFPLFGAAAMVQIVSQLVDKVGELYNAWNPVIVAQERSLELLKKSLPELEKAVKENQKLRREEDQRRFGTSYVLGKDVREARGEVPFAEAKIANLDRQIAIQQGIVQRETTTGTAASERIGKGGAVFQTPGTPGGISLTGQAAQQHIKDLSDQRETAILELNNAILNTKSASAAVAKDALDKERTRQQKIESINKAIDMVNERSSALADKASLSRFGPVGTIEETRRAMERRYAREEADVNDAQRINRLGGPDVVRVPDEMYSRQRAAIAAARQADRQALSREQIAATFKQAEDYKISKSEFDLFDLTHGTLERHSFQERVNQSFLRDANDASKRFRADEQIREIGVGSEREDIVRRSNRAGILARQPGMSEGATITAAYNIRLDLARQLYTLESQSVATMEDSDAKRVQQAKLLADVTKERGEADLEREAKIAELRMHSYQAERGFAGGLFDALQGGGRGVAGFARSQALGVGRTVFQNAVTPMISNIASSLHFGGGGTLGSLLQGTPFGADPVKQATDQNTAATIANTQALLGVSGLSGGGGSTGGFGGALGAIPGLSRVFGGATANPFIFQNNAGGGRPLSGAGGGGGEADELASMQAANSSTFFSRNAANIGKGAAVLGAGFSAYQGFKSGGARGGLQAASSILGAAFVLDPEPVSKAILGIAALTAGTVGALLGDPKQARSNEIGRTLKYSQYVEPVAINARRDVGGGYSDYDRYGNVRTSDLSPYGPVQQPYFDYRNNTIVPGTGGGGPGGPINVIVQTMDAKSFIDHAPQIAAAVARDFSTQGIVRDAMRRTNT